MSHESTPGADNRGQTANLSLAEKRALAERLLQKKASAASVAFPQSYSQRSMWFFHLLDPDSAAYHVAFSTRIRSAVDAPALQAAVQRVVDRHPLLRATYANGEDGPQQIVAGYRQAAFNVIDAAGWSEEELHDQVLRAYAEPFDLENGPVLRVVLFWRPTPHEHESDHVLLVVAHHIVMDAWSAGIVLNELFAFYAAEQKVGEQKVGEQAGEPVVLPPPNRYADYVTWQRQLLAGQEGERLWSYWRHELSGELPVLALPTDFPRPRVQSHAGATALAAIDQDLTARLRTLARSEGVTLYMLLLSAWYTLLSAWAEQEEVLIGSPTVGRSQPSWASVVGDFVNAVVLRLRSHPQQPFRSLLGEVRRQVLEALDHQEYPFALLVERLMGGRRNPSYSPIFQAAFDLQTLRGYGALTPLFLPYDPNARITLAGLELQPYVFAQQEGQFDLALHLIEADDHIHVALRYCTALFSAATTADVLRAYTALLERIAADPTAAVGDLRLSLAGMNARTLLAHLRRQDVKVWVDGDRLRVNAPAGSLSPELQKQIAARKEEIIALLAPAPAAPGAPVADAQPPAAHRNEEAPSEGNQEALVYWSRKLVAPLPVLNLPTDHPRPAQASTRGKRRTFAWDEQTAAALHALGEREGVSVDVILLALLQTLLFHYTRQEDLVIGSLDPSANLVVLRMDLSGAPSFGQLLERVRSVVQEAHAHQPAPFDKLVELLQPERDPARLPFFQVFFAAHSGQAAHTAPEQIEPVTVRTDLVLEAFAGPAGMALQIDYSADLFADATIVRLFGHLTTLLHAVLQDSGARVEDLPLLTAAERQQVLFEFNDTAVPYPQDKCIHQLIEEQVERTPDAVALVFEGQQLTYAQMNRRANQLAQYLQTAGVGPDVLVGVCMERSLEMVIALLGIHKAGGAYVPLDPTYPKERLGFVIADAAAPVVLTQAHLAANLPATAARILCLDRDWPTLSRYADDNPRSAVQAHNRAYVIYTSGSTGQPKGAINAHRGVVNRLLWMQDMYRLQPDDTVLQKTPFSFDVSVWEFFWPLLCGARMVIARPEGHKDPSYLSELIWDQQITTLHFVPSMLNAFLSAESVRPCDSVRRVICSGEALTAELQQRFFAQWQHTELHNLYGPTEAAVDVTYWECRRDSALPIVPIGRPVANTQMYVLDPHLRPVPLAAYMALSAARSSASWVSALSG